MKIWASVERSYHKRKDDYYQELISHYVHFQDPSGNTQTKLDRTEFGKLFVENNTHNSFDGMVIIKENGADKRLLVVEK